MLPSHHQRYPRTNISLDHERRGTAWELTLEQREEAAQGLAILGYTDDARILRAMNERLRRARISAVPDDHRRPLKASANKRPLLMAVENGGGDPEPGDYRRDFCRRMARLADEAVSGAWATSDEKIAWAETARELRSAGAPPQPRAAPPAPQVR